MAKVKTNKDVETCMDELEKIAEKLGDNDIKIEESISLYKEGMNLVDHIQKLLNKYEKEIEIIEN